MKYTINKKKIILLIMKRMKFRNKLIIIIIVIAFLVMTGFRFLDQAVSPVLMTYAKEETYRLATIVINDAISRKVVDELTLDNLFLITTDSNGEIVSIDFNSIIVNKVLTTTTNVVTQNLRYVEEGRIDELNLPDSISIDYDERKRNQGVFCEVPLGVVFHNSLLSNLGPRVPVKLHLVGSIISGIETKVTNYGINNALIEVYVHIQVSLQVILPFISERVNIETSVPVAIKLVRGNIPRYYANGNLSSSLLSVPIE